MPETKHVLTSKIFIGSSVGLVASIAMPIMRSYGYDVVITPAMQTHGTTIILAAVMWWRTRTVKPLHIRKKKPMTDAQFAAGLSDSNGVSLAKSAKHSVTQFNPKSNSHADNT